MAASTPSSGALILIAEDSRTQATQLEQLLLKRGYRVMIACNGNIALQMARQIRPNLVITDVDMPLLDGYGTCRALKQDANLREVPVILLTSLSDIEDVVRGLEAGADYYLNKPYQSDYLLSRVGEILNNPAPASSGSDGPIPFFLNGKPHALTAGRRQILTLLLSTYSDAVQRNKELIESQQLLNRQNKLLDEAARSERSAMAELKEAQSQLVQSEKMAVLGQLVAGIAHEINNPLSFVSNNIAILQRDMGFIKQILELYKSAESGLAVAADLLAPVHELQKRIDLPYTLGNLDEMLDRSRDGLRRIQQIVMDLRDFVRLDDGSLKEADLNAGVESTVNIIRTKARDKQVQLELKLNPLPRIQCYPAKINQVIMNLVANAIDASPPGQTVTVQTSADQSGVRIDVIDHGTGIPAAIRGRIFDPFFTTKEPGKGTGLGLSISFGIVRDHGGRIDVESREGDGASFAVHIPLVPKGVPPKLRPPDSWHL